MALIDGKTWMEHLSVTRCWELLASTPVGRIGVLHDSAPEIYPVNHLVDGDSIVFRSDVGGKLSALDRSPAVCYEVDAIDPGTATGWSVLVKGRAAVVTDPADQRRLTELGLTQWSLGQKAHWIRIVPAEVTGRRIWSRPNPAARQ